MTHYPPDGFPTYPSSTPGPAGPPDPWSTGFTHGYGSFADPWKDFTLNEESGVPLYYAGQHEYNGSRPVSRVWRRIVGVAGAAVVSALLVVGVVHHSAEDGAHAASAQSQNNGESGGDQAAAIPRDVTPEDIPLPSGLEAKLVAALANDKCKTKVTAKEVENAYQALFGKTEKPNMTLAELQTRANEVIDDLTKARAEQQYATLPPNFYVLEKDAVGDRKIGLDEYKKAAQDFFKQYGVDAIFDWKSFSTLLKANNFDRKEMDKSFFNNYAHPISNEVAVGDNKSARAQILGTIMGFSQMPSRLVRSSGLKTIAFGDILDDKSGIKAAAIALTSYPGIVIDISDLAKPSINDPRAPELEKFLQLVARHETEHRLGEFVCGLMTSLGSKGGINEYVDPAYTSFNPGNVQYGIDTMKLLGEQGVVNGMTTIGSGKPGVQTFMEPYSAYSPYEDRATLWETVINPADLGTLVRLGAWGETLKKKAALLVARYSESNPGLAGLLTAQAAAARLNDAIISAAIAAVPQEVTDVLDKMLTTPEEQTALEDAIAKSKAATAPYDALRTAVRSSLVG